jgi:hypothetical protein
VKLLFRISAPPNETRDRDFPLIKGGKVGDRVELVIGAEVLTKYLEHGAVQLVWPVHDPEAIRILHWRRHRFVDHDPIYVDFDGFGEVEPPPEGWLIGEAVAHVVRRSPANAAELPSTLDPYEIRHSQLGWVLASSDAPGEHENSDDDDDWAERGDRPVESDEDWIRRCFEETCMRKIQRQCVRALDPGGGWELTGMPSDAHRPREPVSPVFLHRSDAWIDLDHMSV